MLLKIYLNDYRLQLTRAGNNQEPLSAGTTGRSNGVPGQAHTERQCRRQR